MIAFSLGSLHIYRYGIMYLISFVLGYGLLRWGQRRGWYRNYPWVDRILSQDLDGLLLALMLGVMIGGRLGHVLIYDLGYFLAHPLKILALNEGGMSFIGGIVGVVIAIVAYLTLVPSPVREGGSQYNMLGNKLLSVLDAFIPIVPLGIFFGRFGNFLNQELYGIVVPYHARGLPSGVVRLLSDLQFFHVYDAIGPALRINTNFLSMLFEGLILAIVLWWCFHRYRVDKKRGPGQLSAVFLGGYSLIRFLLEYLRQDSQAEWVGWFTKSQWFFVGFMVLAVVIWLGNKLDIDTKQHTNR